MTALTLASHGFFVALLALIVGVGLGGPGMFARLAFDRSLILDGELWRLLTTHVVHAGPAHLFGNAGGVLLVWAALGRRLGAAAWAAAALAAGLASSLGVLVAQPRVQVMAGLSGLLHGLLAAGGFAEARRGHLLGRVVLVLLALKLAWDMLGGVVPWARAALGGPIAAEAHLFGALGGLLCAVWLPGFGDEGGRG